MLCSRIGRKVSYSKHVIYSSMNVITLDEFPIIVDIVDGSNIQFVTFVSE